MLHTVMVICVVAVCAGTIITHGGVVFEFLGGLWTRSSARQGARWAGKPAVSAVLHK